MALFSSKEPVPQKTLVRGDAQPLGGVTFFGPDVIFEGTLSGSEPVIIEGTIRGKINLAADVRIGPRARVEATVHAKNVIVEGRLDGDVSADDRVELVTSANVEGNIKAPKIIVAEGAKFRGSVDMGSSKPKDGTGAAASDAKKQ
jgi:cytoskeletal protein CcmA (bactofilin family)